MNVCQIVSGVFGNKIFDIPAAPDAFSVNDLMTLWTYFREYNSFMGFPSSCCFRELLHQRSSEVDGYCAISS